MKFDELKLMIRGRALDTAPPALYTLLEIRKNCPEILDKCEVSLVSSPILNIPLPIVLASFFRRTIPAPLTPSTLAIARSSR